MKKHLSTIFRTIISLFILAFAVSATVHAQTASKVPTGAGPGQALEIGPPVVNLKGDPGQTIKAQISLRNISNNKLIVSNEINDFTANGEDGTPKLLLDSKEPDPNSIIPWISPLPQFNLVPKQIQQLNLTLKIPANASPGGFYGVIRFTGRAPELGDTGVALSASIGALVFVRVNGVAKEAMATEEFFAHAGDNKAAWLFESPPIHFVQRLKNNGNIFEKPTGLVRVKDMFGKEMGATNVNLPQSNVLPNTVRKFTQPFDKSVYGERWLFGKYTAEMEVTYGDNAQKINSTITFWIIPYRLIIAIIVGLIALFFIIRFALKRYTESVLSQGRRRR